MTCKIEEIEGIGPVNREKLAGAKFSNADNLTVELREVNAAKQLAKATPSVSVVEGWVEHAKKLDPKISH